MVKNILNVLFLVLCLVAGFLIASYWRPMMRWWNGPGFNHSEPTLVTGVGDAPKHRGFTISEPLADPAKTFGEWQNLWVTAVGIRHSHAWTHEQLATTVKAAHDRHLLVTLMPPAVFSAQNPYAKPLSDIAAEAQAAGVDRLVVSWLDRIPDAAYWQTEVAHVRGIFKGAVMIAGTDDLAPALSIWNLSDYLGVAGEVTLPRRLPHAADNVDYHTLRLAWESQLNSLESLGRSFGKPVALLDAEVPLAFSVKLPEPDKAPGKTADNAELQALGYEALLAETKGRAADTDLLLLPWGKDNRNAANAVSGLLGRIGEAWDPKKPRTPETAPDQFTDADAITDPADDIGDNH